LRLPLVLHERLKKEAEAGERGFAAEVRRRLEASFALDRDPKTRRLLDAIGAAAEVLPQEGGPITTMLGLGPSLGTWHEDPIAYAALARAVGQFMSLLGPGQPKEISEDVLRPIVAMAVGAGITKMVTVFAERRAKDEGENEE